MIKPILFNEQMVRAILEDRKTETRRIVKDNTLFGLLKDPETRIMRMSDEDDFYPAGAHFRNNGKYYLMKPAYKAGDILWVRETWQFVTDSFASWLDIFVTSIFQKIADGNQPLPRVCDCKGN